MTALNMVAVSREYGIRISYLDIFRTPSLRALAQVASFISKKSEKRIPRFSLIYETDRATVIADAIAQCGVSEEKLEDIYPRAPQQEALWSLSLAREGAYVAQSLFTLQPVINVSKFCAALESVVELLPTFRTRFIQSIAGSYQAVIKEKIEWQSSPSLN